MALSWIALAIVYLAGLFWLAKWGDSNSTNAQKITSHPFTYSLALAIYCTAWTFFGSVGEATRNTWSYLPILLGPTLLYLFGYRFLVKLTQVSKKQHITTIADFISSRYGKRQTVALLVTIIALLATIPYIALQLKAIGSAFILVSGQKDTNSVVLGATLFIALFSIYFGTKRVDVTEYRRGFILAISFESIIKLTALIAVAIYGYCWWQQQNNGTMLASFVNDDALQNFQSTTFWAQTLMAAAAVICLPRQFHVAVIDNLNLEHLKTARWLFPLYLIIIAAVIPIISIAGQAMLSGSGNEPDTYVLGLAILSDSLLLKMLVFVGGLSAATAMIIVATLTLSTMLTNDVILPKFLANKDHKQPSLDYTHTILLIRRIVIGVLLLLAYIYQQQMTNSSSLASIGLLAFSLVIQLLPAIIGGLYWKRGHAHGVYAGLIVGVVVWVLWLILPIINESSGLFLHNVAISEGAILSLIANTIAYLLFSMYSQTNLIDRIQAEAFVTSIETREGDYDKHYLNTTVQDLVTLLTTFLGETRSQMLIEEYQQQQKQDINLEQKPHKTFIIFSERALGGVIGASSAKVLVDSALSGKRLNFEEVVNFFDETTQAIQFNISALFTSLESLEQGISVIDKNLHLVAWNKSYVALFDYPDDLVTVGTPIAALIRYNAERGECGVGNIDVLVQKRLDHMRSGTSHRFLRQRSDGRVIEMIGNPLPGGGFVTSFNDVTQHIEIQHALKEANIDLQNRIQKRSEEVKTINAELHLEIQRRADAETELVNARKIAEQANANKTNFLALASHDILQPLNAAKLYLSSLQEEPLEKDAGQIVQKLDDSINASEALIATLLDIARLDQGDMKPHFSVVSIKTLVSPLIDELNMQAKEKGLQLTCKIQDVWLKTDRTYLYRILQNLLSNAIKYTPKGRVLLSVRKRKNTVLLQVWDTGLGIKKDELNNIFGDFYRSGDQSQHGVGLGLGVVTRLGQQLNAPVQVNSTLGRGSCFSIELPSCLPDEPSVAKKLSINNVGLAGLRILCVDDKRENLDAMLTLLNKWQVEVKIASTPDEAMDVLSLFEPQLILMDYNLNHEINGLQLISKIRKFLGYPIPAILVTANQDEEIITQAFNANCQYLSKPLKPAKLRVLLQALQAEGARQ